jgi:hypothetical protein
MEIRNDDEGQCCCAEREERLQKTSRVRLGEFWGVATINEHSDSAEGRGTVETRTQAQMGLASRETLDRVDSLAQAAARVEWHSGFLWKHLKLS